MPVAEEIHARLQAAFAPTVLNVVDDSESHRGHAGFQEGGESHFIVAIAAPAFATMSRLQRHRAIHAAIGPDIMERIHALAIDVKT
ncbi:BolA family protein [Oceaniglobus indicus]|uniref:BolA family protein n=1 Tax=Oceaniglobus indicus TaxID=2047749 RepID=UPI000C17B1CF|nr:BolA family protein [Oceaniglobus indicus]